MCRSLARGMRVCLSYFSSSINPGSVLGKFVSHTTGIICEAIDIPYYYKPFLFVVLVCVSGSDKDPNMGQKWQHFGTQA